MSTFAERVVAGEAFLDKHDPDWWRADIERAIDLDTLDLGSDERCVLGQRCPLEVLQGYTLKRWGAAEDPDDDERYVAYAKELSGLDGNRLIEWAEARGFTLSGPLDQRAQWTELTDEWHRVITERRALVTA